MQTEAAPGYVPLLDGKLYQRPVNSQDAEKPRYPFFIGNVVEPEAARQRQHLKAGGIEVANPCLRFVKHFLRKGRITPLLEDQHDPIPREMVDPQDRSYYDIPIPAGYVPPMLTPIMSGGPTALMGKRTLPGEQIDLILSGAEAIHRNLPRGIVEIRTLKGQPYNPTDIGNGLYLDPKIWEIQRAIFPDYPVLPVLISKVRELLDAAWEHTYLREIVEDMQTSSQQFENYARLTIEQAHVNMRNVAASVGEAMQYTPTDLVLLEQLGMARQDREFQQLAQMTGQATQSSGTNLAEMREMFTMLMQANREEREAMLSMFGKQMAAPIPEPVNATVTVAEEIELPIIIDASTMMQDGYPGQSGYSGFSGAVFTNDTPEGVEAMAVAMADSEQKRRPGRPRKDGT